MLAQRPSTRLGRTRPRFTNRVARRYSNQGVVGREIVEHDVNLEFAAISGSIPGSRRPLGSLHLVQISPRCTPNLLVAERRLVSLNLP